MKKSICLVIAILSLFLTACDENINSSQTIATIEQTTVTASTIMTVDATSTFETTQVINGTNEVSTSEVASTANSTSTNITTPEDDFSLEEIILNGHSVNKWQSTKEVLETDNIILLMSLRNNFNDCPATSYYDKNTGEIKPFCSIDGCDHNICVTQSDGTVVYATECAAGMLNHEFFSGPNGRKALYLNSRIYFPFMFGLYSCTENADDIRAEFLLDESLDADKETDRQNKQQWQFASMFVDGDNIFFRHVDDNNIVRQYRYDTVRRELFDLTDALEREGKKIGLTLYIDHAIDGVIYLLGYKNVTKQIDVTKGNVYDSGEFVGYYVTDYDLELVKLADHAMPTPSFIVDGGYIVREKVEGEDYKSNLVCYTHDGKRKTLIYDVEHTLGENITPTNTLEMMYINSHSLYYYILERKWISDSAINASGGSIYRYDFQTGKVTRIFQNDRYDWFVTACIDEEKGVALLVCNEYVRTENGGYSYKFSVVLLKCGIDDSGDLEIMESVR